MPKSRNARQAQRHCRFRSITSPADRGCLPWQAQRSHSVTVSYDGKSIKYGDIPSNQVIVTAVYMPDVDKAGLRRGFPPGLVAMTQSNCIWCHDFAAPAVGPSFAAIGKRYAATFTTTLADHICNGSAGTWGTTRMPPPTLRLNRRLIWRTGSSGMPTIPASSIMRERMAAFAWKRRPHPARRRT